jgi:hypothetical protein
MEPNGGRRQMVKAAFATAAVALAFATGNAAAVDEFWPEIDGFFKLDERTRVFLMGSLTRGQDADVPDNDPRYENGTLGAHIDISLRPLLRSELQGDDWERNRFLWMRIGYNYIGNYRVDNTTYHEDRGVLELSVRQPATQGITLTGRLKWDLRDIDGAYSNRYRVRAGLEREFDAGGHALVPYAQAEISYDTRYDAWNQQRYEAGIEIAMNSRWRLEPYFARQDNSRADPPHVNAVGLTLKYFH